MTREDGFETITAEELRVLMDDRPDEEYDLIDVRQPSEYLAGHIPGAKLIPLGELERRLGELRPDREQVFYCALGGRSRTAARLAAVSGRFPKGIKNLGGGIRAWKGQKLPDFPPLRAFDEAETFRDTLLTALEIEKGAWIFYTGLLGDPPRGIACSAIQSLAEAKRHHAETVYRFLRRAEDGKPLPPFEELFDRTRGDILASGDPVDVLLQWAKASYDDCMQLAELAVELEYQAYDLYRNMAFDAEDKDEEEAFLALSAQEKELIMLIAGQFEGMRTDDGH